MEQSSNQARLDTGTPMSRQPSPTNPNSETDQSHKQATTDNDDSQEQNGQHSALELQLVNARKELESMVLKYAKSEMIVIQNKNKIDDLDKKLKRATKDNETLLSKVKDLTDEKSALLGNLNLKIVHTSRCEQENERLKQDLSIKTERLEVVLEQFETEQEVHQLTRKQLTQAKESIKRLQAKLDKKQKGELNTDKVKSTREIKCDVDDKNSKKESEDQGGLNTSNNIINGGEVNCDHDSAIFTNTTSDADSLDHSNDKDKLDGHLDSFDAKDSETNNHKVEEDDDGDETVEYDRNLNAVTTTNDNSTVINNKQTIPSGPSLQEQHRVIEMAKLERKIMELKDENHEIHNRLKKFEKLYKDSDCSLSKSRVIIEDCETKITVLSNELDLMKNKISKEKEKSAHLEKKLNETELGYSELEKQIESYKSKEGELLEFTERLSLKQVMLQSDLSAALQRVPEYEERFLSASKHSEELSKQKESLSKQLHKLRQELVDEKHMKEMLIQEKEAVESRLTKSIEELQNEIRVMKKKHINSVKELNKELKNLQNQLSTAKNLDNGVASKKTLGPLELKASMSDTASVQSATLTNCPQVGQPDCASSLGSRTSSTTSLEVISTGQNSHSQQSTRDNLASQDSTDITGTNSLSSENHQSSCRTLHDYDKSSLVDWVVKLQRHIVKRDERIDILQEQINQLIEEVKKKGRLLQHFILREESGLLSTDSMEKNKQQLAKRGSGIMSSLYSSSANDSGLTLELSLEINKKLQALLEDTILKNITLKESLSTLGSEIARLNHTDQTQQQIK